MNRMTIKDLERRKAWGISVAAERSKAAQKSSELTKRLRLIETRLPHQQTTAAILAGAVSSIDQFENLRRIYRELGLLIGNLEQSVLELEAVVAEVMRRQGGTP
jgi:diphthamide synthase (EF-2-diphthine--ammonia ligase)